MKKLILILSLLVVSACTPVTSSSDGDFQKPTELQDCKFFNMRNSSGNVYVVVRCPNSATTTTSNGKHKKRVIVVDGVEFQEKE